MKTQLTLLLLFCTASIHCMQGEKSDVEMGELSKLDSVTASLLTGKETHRKRKMVCGGLKLALQTLDTLIPYYLFIQNLAINPPMSEEKVKCLAAIDSNTGHKLAHAQMVPAFPAIFGALFSGAYDTYRFFDTYNNARRLLDGAPYEPPLDQSACKRKTNRALRVLHELTLYTMLTCNLYAADQLSHISVDNPFQEACITTLNEMIQSMSTTLYWSSVGCLYVKVAETARGLISYYLDYSK